MENNILVELIVPCISALCALLGSMVAFFKGRKAKKSNQSLSQLEQENLLHKYMVEQCKNAQVAVKYLRKDLPKDQIAQYKHNLVMEKVSMYAKGSGYTWYNEEEWNVKLTDYIKETKECQN